MGLSLCRKDYDGGYDQDDSTLEQFSFVLYAMSSNEEKK